MEFWFSPGMGSMDVKVRGMQELRYVETVRQGFDFSCGSAAVATLLTHHYGIPTDELEVFKEMWQEGDQSKIRDQGFSLLDMKRYLQRRGFRADGFQVATSRIEELGVAGIVLLDKLESPHFVVVVGARDGEVLVSDPARGIWNLSVEELAATWNGVFFVVRDRASVARSNFNDADVWKRRRWAPTGDERLSAMLSPRLHELPGAGEVNFD